MSIKPLVLADEKIVLRAIDALRRSGSRYSRGDIRELYQNPFSSHNTSFIGRLALPRHQSINIFCKYAEYKIEKAHGHYGGIAYEAQIYEQILKPAGISAPNFLGAYLNTLSNEAWIFLEFLENSISINKAIHLATTLREAAEWIGSFHRALKTPADKFYVFPKTYTYEYYTGWVSRAQETTKDVAETYWWFSAVCQRFNQALPELLAPPLTVIHGEYYPDNVQLCDNGICPVDWETAAIAAGELDLATLTERWPKAIAQVCEVAYQRARWPKGEPPGFGRRLKMARLYTSFRRLGDLERFSPKKLWRMKDVYNTARQLNWI